MDNFTEPTVDEMKEAFGIDIEDSDTDETTEETTPEVDESDSTPEETNTDTDVTESETEPEQEAKAPVQNNDKQNRAFASMRAENANLKKTMAMMAQVLGVDTKLPPDQLANQLQTQARNAIAKQQNMDPAILERLDKLEAINAEYTQMKAQTKIQSELDSIKESFNATDDDLRAFVEELVGEGYDVSVPGASLKTEFISRNFDKIIKANVDAAVAAEQARAKKAGGASNPDGKQGQESQEEEHEINTISELENFLNKFK